MITPEEYYKEEFNPANWDIVSHLKDSNLFSFNSMMQFAEMYHRSQVSDVSKCYTEKDMDNAYDKGFNDGNQRDLTGSLIEEL